MQTITERFLDGEDFVTRLKKLVLDHSLTNAVLVSSVGGLKECSVRMPGAIGHINSDTHDIRNFSGEYEVISMNGTIDKDGKGHIHVSFSDKNGAVFGGHLKKLTVRNTIEVTILHNPNLVFERKPDELTGFDELNVGKA